MATARNLIIILPLLTLLSLPLWQPLAARFLDPGAEPAGRAASGLSQPGSGTLTMEEVSICQFSKGRKDWQVEAQELITDNDQTDLHLKKVKAIFPDKDQAREGGQVAFQVSGEHARYLKNEKVLTLTDKVLVITDSGYEISTDQARFLEASRQFVADAGVRISGSNLAIAGQTLTYALDTRTLQIGGRVNAKIQ